MIMYLESYANQEDYDNDYPTMYEVLFSKKRLIKALQHALGVSNWKHFLKEEYNSEDTQEVISHFEEHGWKYKKTALLILIRQKARDFSHGMNAFVLL